MHFGPCGPRTGFAQAYANNNKSGCTVADKILNDFIPQFGAPVSIHYYQGGGFEDSLFSRLQEML